MKYSINSEWLKCLKGKTLTFDLELNRNVQKQFEKKKSYIIFIWTLIKIKQYKSHLLYYLLHMCWTQNSYLCTTWFCYGIINNTAILSEVEQLGLWSKLSYIAIVKIPCRSFDGQTTFSFWNLIFTASHMATESSSTRW